MTIGDAVKGAAATVGAAGILLTSGGPAIPNLLDVQDPALSASISEMLEVSHDAVEELSREVSRRDDMLSQLESSTLFENEPTNSLQLDPTEIGGAFGVNDNFDFLGSTDTGFDAPGGALF